MKLESALAGMCLAIALSSNDCAAQSLDEDYWSLAQANEVLDKTRVVELAPNRESLSDAERSTVAKLLGAGEIFNRIYQDSLHPQALESLRDRGVVESAVWYALPYSVRWTPELHDMLASRYRFVTVRYKALTGGN